MIKMSDHIRIIIFSKFPKETNGSIEGISFRDKTTRENIKEAIKYLKSRLK